MARGLRAPVGILLDLDDTIIDYRVAEAACLEIACREAKSRNAGVTADQFQAAIARQSRQFWSDLGWARQVAQGRSDIRSVSRAIFHAALVDVGIDDPDLAHTLSQQYRDLREATMCLFPGALDALARLRARGIRLALVTNGSASYQRMKIERFGLAQCFDNILIEGEFGAGKPDPRVYEAAVQALECRPATAWMVGDDLHLDVAAPQSLGITDIWVDARGGGTLS